MQKVTFIINEDGRVNSEMVVQSMSTSCPDCAEAARTIIREMPAWTPATKNGQPVKVQMTLPVRFQIKNI